MYTVAGLAFAEGGFLVAVSSLVNEEYGTEAFGIVFGIILTFGAIGTYIFDQIFLEMILDIFGDDAQNEKYKLT